MARLPRNALLREAARPVDIGGSDRPRGGRLTAAQQAALYYARKRRRERASGGSFSPLDLFSDGEQGGFWDPSNLSTLFQDAAGTTPVTQDGDPVGLADDVSPNGNDASQAASSMQPQYQSGLLQFDGVDDYLATPFVPQTAGGTLAVKMRASNRDTNQFPIGGGTSNPNRCFIIVRDDGFLGAGVGNRTYTTFVGNEDIRDQTGVALLTWRGNFNPANLYWNGVLVASESPSDAVGSDPVSIGAAGAGAAVFGGDIYGALALDRPLTPEEIAALTAYWN